MGETENNSYLEQSNLFFILLKFCLFSWFVYGIQVNLHILKILPLECENYILAHQVHCLAMLFDFHLDAKNGKRMSTSVIDVGLCKPVSGTLLARSIRGRDRRKMLSWKGMGCSPGYPS